MYLEKRIQASVAISSMSIEPERSENIFPKLDENNCQLQILYCKLSFWIERKKEFPEQSKTEKICLQQNYT